MGNKKSKQDNSNSIARNKRAFHDYAIDDKFEAGLQLTGWEVKSLRAGKGQLVDSYVFLKNGEAWLLGARIEPLKSACTHVIAEPDRMRKLLLNKRELGKIFAKTEQKGYTCLALSMYWKGHLAKCEIALGKGKKEYDKRASEKEKDWNREKARTLSHKA